MSGHNHYVSVAGLVRNDRGEVLLIKSPRRGWEFPGGMVEPGETLTEALRREIREETGVESEVTAFIGVSKNLGMDIVNIDFACRYAGGELTTSEESTEVVWVTPERALQMVTFPVIKKRVRRMLSGGDEVLLFAFRREPFEVYDELELGVGTQNEKTSAGS